MKLGAGVLGGEAPMDGGVRCVAFIFQRPGFAGQRVLITDASIPTLPAEHTQFQLGHVEPAAMLGRVVELQPLEKASSFGGRKGFVQGRRPMGVQVVQREARIGFEQNLRAFHLPGTHCAFSRECQQGELIASPASLGKIGRAFVAAVEAYAQTEGIPLVHFPKGQRKDDLAARYRRKFEAEEGVVLIGVAQEQVLSFKARKETFGRKGVRFHFTRQSVFVKVYYFYLQDAEFGPAFIKIATYMPYPVKVCFNGHEWAKQQLRRARVAFEALDNGFMHGQMAGWVLERNDSQHLCPALEQVFKRHQRARRLHLIWDNGPSHISQTTRDFLKDYQPWLRVLFAPTHASWLNQAKLLLRAFTQYYLKRGAWCSPQALSQHLLASGPEYNRLFAHPFQWLWTRRKMDEWIERRTAGLC